MSEQTTLVRDIAGASEGLKWTQDLLFRGLQGGPVLITMGREKRSKDQNAKMWPMLEDLAVQVEWFGKKHTKEQWKEIVTGTFFGCEFVPNIEKDGFIALGVSTRNLDKSTFSQIIEYIYAFGAEEGVIWSEKALETYEEYRKK